MLVALNAQSLLTYLRQSMKAWFRVGIATTIGGKSGILLATSKEYGERLRARSLHNRTKAYENEEQSKTRTL
jgi:hypothetical protein